MRREQQLHFVASLGGELLEAAPDLRHQLEYLGSPDAQGRRQFGPITYGF